ncbi:RNA polymerase sigma factor [Amedibacillus sp. YH-ame10]
MSQQFEEKYKEYNNTLHKICLLHLKNGEDVKDVLQNTFLKLCYRAPAFQDKEHEKRWLIRVAINECKSHQRSFWQKKVTLDEEMIYADKVADLTFLYTIQSLPFTYRNVIHLFYYERYSIKEIAELLEISESAVKMRLKRAKEKLKSEIEEDL